MKTLISEKQEIFSSKIPIHPSHGKNVYAVCKFIFDIVLFMGVKAIIGIDIFSGFLFVEAYLILSLFDFFALALATPVSVTCRL